MNGIPHLTPLPSRSPEEYAAWMAALKAGEMEPLGRLYQEFGGFVNHAIISTAPSLTRSDVEDLCQDVFLAIRKGAKRYKEEGKLKSWIYSVAVRTTKERRRKWANRNRLLGMFKGMRPGHSTTQTAAPDVGAMARTDMVKVLEQLPDLQRQVLILFEKDGMKGEEIAALLNMNINTVWTHLRRARESLGDLVVKSEPKGGAS